MPRANAESRREYDRIRNRERRNSFQVKAARERRYLQPWERRLIVARHYADISGADIARELGVSGRTVYDVIANKVKQRTLVMR